MCGGIFKMKTKVIILILFLFSFSQSIFSLPKEILIIKGSNDYAPYEIKLGNNKYSGIYIETIQEAAKILKIKLVFKDFPWARCLSMMKAGKADALMTPFKNKERVTFMYFANEPVAYEETTLFTYKGSNIKFSGNLNDIKEHKIGVARGYSYGEKWDKINFPNVTKANTQKGLVKMLTKKRFEITLGTKYIIQYLAKEQGVSHKIVALKPSLSKDGGYIAFSKKKGRTHKELANAFEKALKKVKKSARYKQILKKYGIK